MVAEPWKSWKSVTLGATLADPSVDCSATRCPLSRPSLQLSKTGIWMDMARKTWSVQPCSNATRRKPFLNSSNAIQWLLGLVGLPFLTRWAATAYHWGQGNPCSSPRSPHDGGRDSHHCRWRLSDSHSWEIGRRFFGSHKWPSTVALWQS